MTIKYQNQLSQIGLSANQATIYALLLELGPLTARKLHQQSGIKRALAYKVLGELTTLKLIEQVKLPHKAAHFVPLHPVKLKQLAERQEREAKDAQTALTAILPNLESQFNFALGAPGVSFYKGLEGLEKVYDDIINTKNDLLLFRSSYDNDQPALLELINKQIKRQVDAGVRTMAITPIDEDPPHWLLDKDENNLVTRKMVPKGAFLLESQIIVYGKKVVITSLKNDLITTLINNPNISETFRVIFRLLWQLAEPEHQKLHQQILEKKQKAELKAE
ncbi:MAG: helix-turn-helix domain-containing protein [bacterium]|nr:helix-turn-helix domain-containing protein [bacterium]